MKSLFVIVLFISCNVTIGQDTLEIKERLDFNNIIWESFLELNGNIIDNSQKASIDSIFKTFEFNDSLDMCQYFLTFVFELDSCGNVINCKTGGIKNYTGIVAKFQSKVNDWFINYCAPIPNYCLVGDQNYFQLGFSLHVEISCEPRELLYWEDNTRISQGTVFMHQTENGPIYFSGYSNFCSNQ